MCFLVWRVARKGISAEAAGNHVRRRTLWHAGHQLGVQRTRTTRERKVSIEALSSCCSAVLEQIYVVLVCVFMYPQRN